MIVLHWNWVSLTLKGTAAWLNQTCPLIITVQIFKNWHYALHSNTFLPTAAASLSLFYMIVLYITQSVSESARLIPKDKIILFH